MNSARTFIEVPRGTRARVEALIESLVDLLDTIDGDPDLEDDDVEWDQAECGVADQDALEMIYDEMSAIRCFADFERRQAAIHGPNWRQRLAKPPRHPRVKGGRAR